MFSVTVNNFQHHQPLPAPLLLDFLTYPFLPIPTSASLMVTVTVATKDIFVTKENVFLVAIPTMIAF